MYNPPYSKNDLGFLFEVKEPFEWSGSGMSIDKVYDDLKLADVSFAYLEEFNHKNLEESNTTLEEFFDQNEPFAKACLEKALDESEIEIQFSESRGTSEVHYYLGKYRVEKGENNKIKSFSGIIKKISIDQYYERKLRDLSEELNQRINELQKINFATSHRIRSPLARILGLIEILKLEGKYDPYIEMIEACGKELDDEIRKFAKLIEKDKSREPQ